MLLVTRMAEQKLKEIVQREAPHDDMCDMTLGVRVCISGPNNGDQAGRCKIGLDQAQAEDQVKDIDGMKLLFDPLTSAWLSHVTAVLDLLQAGPQEDFVLLIDGSSEEQVYSV
jgi:Fe-S cluster assembly iron-binding protein IscA